MKPYLFSHSHTHTNCVTLSNILCYLCFSNYWQKFCTEMQRQDWSSHLLFILATFMMFFFSSQVGQWSSHFYFLSRCINKTYNNLNKHLIRWLFGFCCKDLARWIALATVEACCRTAVLFDLLQTTLLHSHICGWSSSATLHQSDWFQQSKSSISGGA